MALKLMYITNRKEIAALAQSVGVDRIFVDLEYLGKEERQGHLDTVISRHKVEDVAKIRKVVTTADLLVRVDPINEKSKEQIDTVIESGADIIMLPMFKTVKEIKRFISIVNKRAKVMLLLETPQALARIDDILQVPGIDEIHIGLNDLYLGMGLDFMFELLSDGIVEYMIKKIKPTGIPYGIGGVARIGYGMLPAEQIICEHYRLGSSMAILSRSFCDANKLSVKEVEDAFQNGVKNIRAYEKEILSYTTEQFEVNRILVKQNVDKIVEAKNNI